MNISVNIATNIKTPEVLRKVNDAAIKAVKDIVLDIESEAKHNHSYKDKTGHNTRSITSEANGLSGSVYSTSGYGGWLEVGTRPHTISAKKAKVLTDGKSFFGKTVHHPGFKPFPYLYPALIKHFTQDKFAEKIKDNLK